MTTYQIKLALYRLMEKAERMAGREYSWYLASNRQFEDHLRLADHYALLARRIGEWAYEQPV